MIDFEFKKEMAKGFIKYNTLMIDWGEHNRNAVSEVFSLSIQILTSEELAMEVISNGDFKGYLNRLAIYFSSLRVGENLS